MAVSGIVCTQYPCRRQFVIRLLDATQRKDKILPIFKIYFSKELTTCLN